MRAFEAASRHLSFKNAAAELFVTPAAISQQIRLLENQLGIMLFVRLNRGLRLTEEGAELTAGLQEGFGEIEAALRRLPSRAGYHGENDVLRLNVLPSFAIKFLAARLPAFIAAEPGVGVQMDASDEMLDSDDMRSFDLAIRYGPGTYAGRLARQLTPNGEVTAVCAPGLLREATELRGGRLLPNVPLIHTKRPESALAADTPSWRLWFERANVATTAVMPYPMFSNAHLAIDAAIAGQGIALAPRLLVVDDLAAGRLVQPFKITLPDPSTFWLLCQHPNTRNQPADRFSRWLQKQLSDALHHER